MELLWDGYLLAPGLVLVGQLVKRGDLSPLLDGLPCSKAW